LYCNSYISISLPATLNYIRSLLRDGFDDIVHFPSTWDLDFVKTNENMSLHHDILERVTEETFRLHKLQEEKTKAVINISHEAILLDYEDAMTREFEGKNYNLSAPFVWIGDRTRQLDHAHVEYVRHIENPIGIKVGPSMEAAELIELLKLVWPNPEKTPGKVTLITRYGVPNVSHNSLLSLLLVAT
jgi:3-deoxy-7-phosphoheptulonate synthase